MKDLVWGIGTRLVNLLQARNLMPDKLRSFLRGIGHIVLSAPKERTIITKSNHWLITPHGHKGSRSYVNGTYEQALYEYLTRTVKNGDVFLDIGGFIGYYSVILSEKIGYSGEIHVFEPENDAFHYLSLNVSLNNIQNITAYNVAVSDKAGYNSFELSSEAGVGSAGGFVKHSGSGLKVECIAIDDLGLKGVNWIKLDTDGHETQALLGLRETIDASPNVKLILEIDPSHFSISHDRTSLTEILLSLGFTHCLICEEGYRLVSVEDLCDLNGHRNVVMFKA